MANAITDLDQVKDAAHIAPTNGKWDSILTDWIAIAGDAYQRRYQLLLDQASLTENYYDISSDQLLSLRHGPVASITSINTYDTEDASTTPVTLVVGSDYRLQDTNTGIVKMQKLGSFIPVGLMESMALTPMIWAKIVVVYVAGFVTVPTLVQRGAALLISHWYDQYGDNQELKSSGIGDIKAEFFDYTSWPETVKEMFASYDTMADKYIGVI